MLRQLPGFDQLWIVSSAIGIRGQQQVFDTRFAGGCCDLPRHFGAVVPVKSYAVGDRGQVSIESNGMCVSDLSLSLVHTIDKQKRISDVAVQKTATGWQVKSPLIFGKSDLVLSKAFRDISHGIVRVLTVGIELGHEFKALPSFEEIAGHVKVISPFDKPFFALTDWTSQFKRLAHVWFPRVRFATLA